jgi:hypothetical protein
VPLARGPAIFAAVGIETAPRSRQRTRFVLSGVMVLICATWVIWSTVAHIPRSVLDYVFWALIFAINVPALWRFRRKAHDQDATQRGHNGH